MKKIVEHNGLQEESVTGVQSRPCAHCAHSHLHRHACYFPDDAPDDEAILYLDIPPEADIALVKDDTDVAVPKLNFTHDADAEC